MRNTTLVPALLLALLSIPAAGNAQEDEPPPCEFSFTVGECFRYEIGEFQAGEVVDDEATRATTGAQTANEEVSTAVRDFLPRVGAALLLPGVDEDRAGLALRLNRYLGPVSAQLGVDLNDPTVYAPLLDSIPESIRAASKERLEDELEDQDDVTFSLALNLESRGFGRNVGQYRREVSALVASLTGAPADQTAVIAALPSRLLTGLEGARLAEKQSLPECAADLRADEVQLLCLRPSFADSLQTALRNVAEPFLETGRRRNAALQAPAFAVFGQLLNNQPQANLTLKYRLRDDIVGPSELTFNGRVEIGRYNLNWLRGRCVNGALTAQCLSEALTGERLRGISRAARGWASVEGTWRDEYELDLTADSVDLREARTLEIKLQAGYGQYFGAMREEGTRRPRIDLDVGYVLQREDVLRNDRATASLAYTHPFSSTSAGVFGVRWASKPEFLGDVDRNISATLGLTYKLVNDDDK